MVLYLHVALCSLKCSDYALNQLVHVSDTLQFPPQRCLTRIFRVLIPVMLVGWGLGSVGLELGALGVSGLRRRGEEILVILVFLVGCHDVIYKTQQVWEGSLFSGSVGRGDKGPVRLASNPECWWGLTPRSVN